MIEPCQLAERYPLIPLKPGTKEPHAALLKSLRGSARWKPLAESPATPADVERWQEFDPDMNFGIITGMPSHLAVLDVDDPLTMPCQRFSPAPPLVMTGRGFHLYFKADGRVKTWRLPWGEVKADGGYVVIPPSIHPDGTKYFWGTSLLDHDPPPLPEWLKENESIQKERLGKGQEGDRECLSTVSGEYLSTDPQTKYCTKYSLPRMLESEVFVKRAAAFFGSVISSPEEKFTCPLHPEEREPSAQFFKGREGSFIFVCFHLANENGSPGKTFRLGDVYRSRVTGDMKKNSKVASTHWLLRLAIDCGYLTPPDVKRPRLPEDAPEHVVRFMGGCVLLQQCRLIYDATNNSFPATVGFMTEWCGLKESDALGAKRWLVARGHLVVHQRGQPHQQGRKGAATLYRLQGTGG
ncbi:MAG: bifunctional DNA primase/polymerase [Actinomycetia bacterium]|nr:bifunctional DNA primase/polymerase [Actinomycetes bacterium]